jgi:pimeloyl-ACP methyl ester carboxylesterase
MQSFVLALTLFGLLSRPGRAFAPQALTQPRQSTQFATTATPSTANPVIIPRTWDFQGHECYSEVAQPVGGKNMFSKPKPEVLLIHGFACSTVYWRETCKALTQAGYTVHSLDLLGQGKSAKPGRAEGVEYSINLWAQMVEQYAQQYIRNTGVVVMGNSLGSLVALSAATGDHTNGATATLPSKIQGIGLYNVAIGMNSRNILKDPSFNPVQRTLLTFVFDLFDKLIFDNIPLLTYILEKVVTKELLQNALIALYQCAPDPQARVDDALVDSFYLPAQDAGSIETLNQIYTNDPGKTPMELHQDHSTFLENIPIHLVWGTQDKVTPLDFPVGQFYADLADDASKPLVSINAVEAGHVPFDEIPESNDSMVQWLETIVVKQQQKNLPQSGFQWPSFS